MSSSCKYEGSVLFATLVFIEKNRCTTFIDIKKNKINIENILDTCENKEITIDSEILLLDLDANIVKLEKLYLAKPIIVFRFSEKSCWSCADLMVLDTSSTAKMILSLNNVSADQVARYFDSVNDFLISSP